MSADLEQLLNYFGQLSRKLNTLHDGSPQERIRTKLQYGVLHLLHKANAGLTMSDISKELGLSLPSCTQLIERLEKLNWVERKSDQIDRRKVSVYLTQTGEENRKIGREHMLKIMEATFGSLPENDLKTLLKIYQKILKQP